MRSPAAPLPILGPAPRRAGSACHRTIWLNWRQRRHPTPVTQHTAGTSDQARSWAPEPIARF